MNVTGSSGSAPVGGPSAAPAAPGAAAAPSQQPAGSPALPRNDDWVFVIGGDASAALPVLGTPTPALGAGVGDGYYSTLSGTPEFGAWAATEKIVGTPSAGVSAYVGAYTSLEEFAAANALTFSFPGFSISIGIVDGWPVGASVGPGIGIVPASISYSAVTTWTAQILP